MFIVWFPTGKISNVTLTLPLTKLRICVVILTPEIVTLPVGVVPFKYLETFTFIVPLTPYTSVTLVVLIVGVALETLRRPVLTSILEAFTPS